MHAYRALVPALAILLSLAGAYAVAPERHTTVLVLRQGETRARTIEKGTLIEVRLAATFGTGLSWQLHPLLGTILVRSGEGISRRQADDPKIDGAPDIQFFRFVAEQAGTVRLSFEYRHPWLKERPAKTYSVTLHVRPAR